MKQMICRYCSSVRVRFCTRVIHTTFHLQATELQKLEDKLKKEEE